MMNPEAFTRAQLAGQRLMIGFDGITLTSDLQYFIKELKVGGVILFSRNIKSPDQLASLCDAIQSYADSCGQPPLFISIDQEGGVVARLKAPFTEFPGNPAMNGEADAVKFAEIASAELKQVGINMNLTPVMDVAPKEMNSIMTDRVFGHDPAHVARMGCTVIRELQKNGIMACAKHFPGIGRTILDSHHDLPYMQADLEDLASFDLPPFEAAINADVAGIMLSHILYEKIDPDWPASLSPLIARHLLREKMKFRGLVLTDDLDMGAIRKHYDLETGIRQSLEADIDAILICHQGPDIERAFQLIHSDLCESTEMRRWAEASAKRILSAKFRYIPLIS